MAVSGLPEPQFVGPGQQVVALDVRDVDREAEPRGQRAHRVGQPGRVQPAGVGDDAHALVQGQAEAVLELAQEVLA